MVALVRIPSSWPAPKTDHFRQKVRAFLDKYKNSIDEVINKFGRMSARELELCSTIIYVFNQSLTGKDDLIFRVKEIKPHFSINEINDAVKQLMEYKIINPPTS
jgi:hypothetical protein